MEIVWQSPDPQNLNTELAYDLEIPLWVSSTQNWLRRLEHIPDMSQQQHSQQAKGEDSQRLTGLARHGMCRQWEIYHTATHA